MKPARGTQRRLGNLAAILAPTQQPSPQAQSPPQRHLKGMTESTIHPPSGLYRQRPLETLYYGPLCVQKNLLDLLPTPQSKAFIITGQSLATKTPLIKDLEALLGSKHHAGTFANIKQHAPVAQLDEATNQIQADDNIDTLISVGGGSPIDSAKAISHRTNEKKGRFMHHIAIPTTLSAAECTMMAGFTQADGVKTGVAKPELSVNAILYDPGFAAHTPTRLWVSTGVRALDHAVETMYNATATELTRTICVSAVAQLAALLPVAAKKEKQDDDDLNTRLFLASYMSLGYLGMNMKGGLGLSHSLGYALGSPYGIPHGETSCLTLGHVVKLKARTGSDEERGQIQRLLVVLGGKTSADAQKDAEEVGARILELVQQMGLYQPLTARGVQVDQVDIITQRATGGKTEGPLFDAVKKLVQGLY